MFWGTGRWVGHCFLGGVCLALFGHHFLGGVCLAFFGVTAEVRSVDGPIFDPSTKSSRPMCA